MQTTRISLLFSLQQTADHNSIITFLLSFSFLKNISAFFLHLWFVVCVRFVDYFCVFFCLFVSTAYPSFIGRESRFKVLSYTASVNLSQLLRPLSGFSVSFSFIATVRLQIGLAPSPFTTTLSALKFLRLRHAEPAQNQ